MLAVNRLLFFAFLSVIGQGIVGATAARQQVLGFDHPATTRRAGRLVSPKANPFTTVSSKAQNVFRPSSSQARYNESYGSNNSLFTPFENFSALSTDTFTVLAPHPLFPNHSIRIKKSDVCGTDVKSYTGYIDVGARHLFFYFFESRGSPDKDDVIFWTNGGPGCSSALGVFMEVGPCRVLDGKRPTYHPESWNANANILLVDQPVGVGFSYAEFGESVTTTEEAAQDIAAFVAIFFEHFNTFKGRAFHMASESYGGRYIPLFASAVYDQNAKLVQAGIPPVNLTSIMIGNGFTDFATMIPSYYDLACTPKSLPPVLDISTCVRMKRVIPKCEKWMTKACIDSFDDIDCGAATTACSSELSIPLFQTGLNPYDLTKQCEGPIEETLCYSVIPQIASYLDHPKVREALGVDPSFGNQRFMACDAAVDAAFGGTLDMFHQTKLHVAALLDRGVRALIYAGTYDWICNWVGNERWTLELEWSGQEAFVSKELEEWEVDGKKAGLYRSSGLFTFVTVDGAGHMVPFDKPMQALEMVNRWLAGGEF